MKKFGAILVSAFILSCSVEDEFLPINENLQEISAVVEVGGCEIISYPFEEAGVIEITNDEDFIYISLAAANGYDLTRSRLHLAGELSEFPLRGKGVLPPGQMEYDEPFSSPVSSHTFKFPLSKYSQSITIASLSEFQFGGEKVETWAGDQLVNYGNWSYIIYEIQQCDDPCKGFDAGPYNSMEISQSLLPTLVTYQITNLYRSLLKPSVPKNGAFNPSIRSLINLYKSREGDEKLGDYTTTYTITDGDCIDSVDLTLTVVPD